MKQGVRDMRLGAFEFFEIVDQHGLPELIDGIMGLSRKWEGEDYVTGPLLLEQLFAQGVIS